VDPADRIDHIREISLRLENLDVDEVLLVLGQFGTPTGHMSGWDDVDADRRRMARWSVEDSDPETLTGLLAYLTRGEQDPLADDDGGTKVEATETDRGSALWAPDSFRLFMSHVAVHKVFVSEVKKWLVRWGIDGFVAHEDIEPGREWEVEIERGLRTCDALVAFLTPEFPTSKWCDQEVGYCVGRLVPIVPVRLGLDPYGFIGRYQGIQGHGLSSYQLTDVIAEALVTHEQTAAKLAAPFVDRLNRSASWDRSRALMSAIERLPAAVWTPELLRRLQDAMNNSEVSNSFTVPERIEALVGKYSH
jgi:hypothetical protein